MNNKRIKSIKNIFCYLIAFVLASFGCISLLNLYRPKLAPVKAVTGESTINVPNGNFKDSPSATYPFSSSSYKKYIYNTEVTSSIDPNVTAGIINLNDLDDEDFAYKLKDIPTDVDDYALMIDSEDYEHDRYLTTNFGYRTSQAISLSAGKNYLISLDAYTLQNEGIASIYLYNGSEVFASFKNVKSPNHWNSYNFFIKTNNNESLSLVLGMYLEGAGTVLFDNISCKEYNDNLYNNMLSSALSNKKEIDLVDNIIAEYTVNNEKQLVNINDSTDYSGFTQVDFVEGKSDINYTSLDYATISDGEYNSALLLQNIKDTYVKYSTKDDFFTFEQGKVYKVSVRARLQSNSGSFTGKATMSLVQTDKDKNNNITTTLTTATSSTINNNFAEYTFFVNSHPTEDSHYKFEFALGDSETLTSGKLYISNISVNKTNYSQFDSASTDSKVNLATDSIYSSSNIMIDNGTFDGFKVTDYNSIYPATPIDWTVTTGSNTQNYGVVNSDSNVFPDLGITRPYASGENNNVLLMQNTTADKLIYKSNSKSLSANTYHKFQLNVKTINADAKISLVTTVDSKEVTLSSLVIHSTDWKQASLYLHTGYETSLSVAVKVELITEGAGYAYIDEVRFDYPDTSKTLEDQYNLASNVDNLSIKTDLSDLLSTPNTTPWSSTTFFNGTGSNNVDFGIIPTNNDQALTESVIEASDLHNFKKVSSNVLGIRLTNGYYSAKANLAYQMESSEDKYYKISVSVFTKYLEYELAEDEELVAVSIGLSNYEEKFTGIESNGDWTTYTFYIDPNTAGASYLTLSLGSEDQTISGVAFFGDVKFESIDKTTFDNETAVDNDNILVLETVIEEDAEEDKDDTTSSEDNNSNWYYAIPTIVFALSIVIAVVGVSARKLKKSKKKSIKKTKNNYDRNSTVSKQFYMRKATTIRENKLNELDKDLARLSEERAQYEIDYKQNMSKLRDMKIHRADARDIANLEHSMKKAQKRSAAIGVAINNIEMEIQYIKTDSYLNSLMKKLAREGIPTEETEDKE